MTEKIYEEANFYPARYGNGVDLIWPNSRERKIFESLPTGVGGIYTEQTKRENDWIRARQVKESGLLKDAPPTMVCFPHCNPVLAFRSDIYWGNVKNLVMFEENRTIYDNCAQNLNRNMNLLCQIAKGSRFNKWNLSRGELFHSDFFSRDFIDFRRTDWSPDELAYHIFQEYDGVGIWDLDVWNINKPRLERVVGFIKNLSPRNFVVRMTMWPRRSIETRIKILVDGLSGFAKLENELSLRHFATTEQTGSVDPMIWQGIFSSTK